MLNCLIDKRGKYNMKTAIIYYSKHHGNTKKLLDAIVEKNPDVKLIDVTDKHEVNLCKYDRIGIASGIYYGNFAKQVITFAKVNLPEFTKVFLIYTYGANNKESFTKEIKKVASDLYCDVDGVYSCNGFDTFGPLRLIGGIHRENPTQDEINGAVDFYAALPGEKIRRPLRQGGKIVAEA